jgi:hypothetical protein
MLTHQWDVQAVMPSLLPIAAAHWINLLQKAAIYMHPAWQPTESCL